MNLRDSAIYRLPNGRELVAYMTCDNKTVLFSLNAAESRMYELNSEGRLVFDGNWTAWQIDDLLETGQVAAAEITSMLTERSMADSEGANERSI